MKKPQTDKIKLISYSKLAWTEPIVGPPEEYAEDTELFVKVIKEHSIIKPRTLLHLGCGAGGNDYTFKKYFKVTGIDISSDMLKMAKRMNPEVTYYNYDMRNLKLDKTFDAVAIPDSIGYMVTEKDLKRTISSAYNHLKPGGVILIVACIKEEFKENNFLYTGANKDTEITVFENNYISEPAKTTYEATIVYLIRKKGKLKIYSDRHIIGLFNLKVWLDIFKEFEFVVKKIKMEHSYDRFVLGDGVYPLTIFACTKPLT
ncbi:MAG: class I SAM-dependent methyltransferase [Actinobacteria bacterium]|nr:class I SAM-dependent methyltransferase [Actinomycetota bacterium]